MSSPNTHSKNSKISVFLIETNETSREFYAAALNQLDMLELRCFSSGKELLELIPQGQLSCDILIVDLNDRQPLGHALIQKIQSNTNHDHIDIIASARNISEEDLILLEEFDIHGWYQKQSEVGNLVEMVMGLILKKQSETSLTQLKRRFERAVRENKVDRLEEILQNLEFSYALKSEAQYLYLYGEYLILTQQIDEAINYLNNAIVSTTDSKIVNRFKNLNVLAKALCLAGRFKEAEEIYLRLVERSPKNLSYHNGLGEAQISQGDSVHAREQFESVIKIDPQNDDAHIGLAKVNLFEGNIPETELELQKVSEPIENYSLASFFNNRAVTFVRLGKTEEAISLYKVALKHLDRYRGFIFFNLGLAYSRLGKRAEAENCYQEAIKAGGEKLISKKQTLRNIAANSEEQFITNKKIG